MKPIFLQAEDGIRDVAVTGVQTCALPIYPSRDPDRETDLVARDGRRRGVEQHEIGRASCRERVEMKAGDGGLRKEIQKVSELLVGPVVWLRVRGTTLDKQESAFHAWRTLA